MNRIWIGVSLPLLLLTACAAEIHRIPTSLLSNAAAHRAATGVVFNQTAAVRTTAGYERTIAALTRFEQVGSIAQGQVYRALDTVFAVQGRHQHEAYLVLDGARLVGFFLPVEQAFSPAAPVITIDVTPF